MKNYIIGAGGLSKEIYYVLKRNNLECHGFINLNEGEIKLDAKVFEVFGENKFINLFPKNVNLYVGIGNPKILTSIKQKYIGYIFPNLIDPSAHLLGSIKMGIGNIFCCDSILTTDITMGSFNIFNTRCTIGHDVIIGDCNIFNPTSCISGNVTIDNENLFGVNSTVLETLSISSNNIIGANSLITKNIKHSGIYIGLPAKRKEQHG